MKKAVSSDPSYEDGYITLGNLLYDEGKYKEAGENYLKALSISPVDEHSLFRVGECLFLEEDYTGAVSGYRKLLKEYPDNAMGHYKTAASLALINKNEEALRELKIAVRKDPELEKRAGSDPAFEKLKQMPEFQKIIKR